MHILRDVNQMIMKTFDSKPNSKSRTLDATPKSTNQASIADVLQAYKGYHAIDVADRKQSMVAGFPTVAQLSLYEVSKAIPLVGYRKEAKDTKDYWTKSIDALRSLYPGRTDEDRGSDFLSEKEKIAQNFDVKSIDGHDEYSFKDGVDKTLGRAKMEHIPVGTTSRNGTMATLVKNCFGKKTPGVSWMGGHLIKDSWGGIDNMMNVAVWDKNKAEKKWSEQFEDPLEAHFLIDPSIKFALLNISMVKEDEILPLKEIDFSDFGNKTQAYLSQKVEKIRWDINNAVETIPICAHGDFLMKKGSEEAPREIRGSVDVDKEDTGYKAVSEVVEVVLSERVDGVKRSIGHVKDSIESMSGDPSEEQEKIREQEVEKRSIKRVEAMLEEYRRLHLTPEQFEQNIEPGKISMEELIRITESY